MCATTHSGSYPKIVDHRSRPLQYRHWKTVFHHLIEFMQFSQALTGAFAHPLVLFLSLDCVLCAPLKPIVDANNLPPFFVQPERADSTTIDIFELNKRALLHTISWQSFFLLYLLLDSRFEFVFFRISSYLLSDIDVSRCSECAKWVATYPKKKNI